ncbi:MAG TPA: bifunctional 5,10-methylenetetrahydrofolate dehydrogenase/5,10-methenyltetrahydrofolate cyclohydrolase [Thermodesulfobacteriota bacterium]|nr:bifunctional 5,10-methylenetetrahydrofolate dehydrogenase/5,10-methenyltetrahydrofolate cyclohydrolase [Thermodesulfobacteriota bacterium]
MAQILDGRAVAQGVRARVAAEVAALRAERGVVPGLAAVLVGDDPASALYVRNKERACREAGMVSTTHRLPADTPETALLALLARLNADPAVHAILVQLPLPGHIDQARVLGAVAPHKDVDGFHPENVGLLTLGRPRVAPATPRAVLALLDAAGIDPAGRRAVVIGRSQIVGKPTALLLLQRHATVTICHSRTTDLPRVVGEAEIVVAALGRPQAIRGEWLRPGAAVIDVGITRLPDGRLVGDVDFEGALARAAVVTPVPGGVGPMTIAMLLDNTLTLARSQAAGAAGAGR